jgi:hypothetical protein
VQGTVRVALEGDHLIRIGVVRHDEHGVRGVIIVIRCETDSRPCSAGDGTHCDSRFNGNHELTLLLPNGIDVKRGPKLVTGGAL